MPDSQLIIPAAGVAVGAVTAVLAMPVRVNCRRVGIEDTALGPGWVPPLIAAAAAGIIAARYPDSWHTVVICAALPLLIWCAWIDLRTKRIPTTTVYAATAVVLAAGAAVDGLIDGQWARWAMSWVMGLAAAGVLLVLALVTRGSGVGAADVRLIIPVAAVVGFSRSWSGVAAMFLISFLVLLPAAAASLVRRRSGDPAPTLPYGPALLVAALAAIAAGD